MEQPEAVEAVDVQPSPKGYRLIAEQYLHEVLQTSAKGKRKSVVKRMQAYATICVFLSHYHPDEYAFLINDNPFASKTRLSWEEIKSLR